ncbi:MAG TPA: hypothetical protein VMU59_00270 [Caulobacteraceae bacterium]|nr:hypothetical protein [Caulobacteraceae bacterium]
MRAGSVLIPLAATAALALAGCGRSAPWAPARTATAGQPANVADDGGYRPPPRLLTAARGPDGQVTLAGQGLPGAAVRLSSPDGQEQTAEAGAAGEWTLTVPAHNASVYGLSQEADGRRDQAQGYLLVLPGSGPAAAELRSGAGARTMPPNPLTGLRLDAVDLDASGAAVVSGWTAASQSVRVLIDGAPVDDGAASPTGRFSLALPKPLPAGPHLVQVLAANTSAQVSLDVAAPAPFGGVLHAVPRGSGWRVDWLTPAGGVQTTFLFKPSVSGEAKP